MGLGKYRIGRKLAILGIGLGLYMLLSCPGDKLNNYDTHSISDPYKGKTMGKKITKSMPSLRVSDGD